MINFTYIKIAKLAAKLVLVALLSISIHIAATAAESSSNQICNSEGAFGIKLGDKYSGTRMQADTFLFGDGCYLVKPNVTMQYFDTYAACVSEFDGKIYKIQAAKTFDTKPPQGELELTPEQVSSNRELGKLALKGVLSLLPKELSTKAITKLEGEAWELSINDNITLEVSNYPSWSVTFECRNETKAVEVFKKRIWGR